MSLHSGAAPLGATQQHRLDSAAHIAIEARGACRDYDLGATTVRAIDNVTLTVRRGEFVALLGPSGSGKSTLLHLFAGLDRPSSGRVIVEGHDLAAMDSEALARHRRFTVGMIFQSFYLIPTMTLTDNIALPLRFAEVPREERGERVRELLNDVGLAHRAHHRPTQLSGGEQQRAAIARALANRPTVLLADEPTGNIDSRNGQEIMSLLAALNETMHVTILLVTHDAGLAARYAHRSLHIADGRLVSPPTSAAEPQA